MYVNKWNPWIFDTIYALPLNHNPMNPEKFPQPDDANENEGEHLAPKSPLGRWLKTTAIAAGSLVGFGAGGENQPADAAEHHDGRPQQSLHEKFEAAQGTATDIVEQALGSNWKFDIFHTFFKKDKDGNEVLNLGALLVPFEVVATKESNSKAIAEIVVPYALSRLYNTAQSLDPEAKAKTEAYIRQKLLNSFAEKVHNWGFALTDGVLESKRPLDTGLGQIQKISIWGHSSPEGKDADSLKIGNVDPKNEDLALRRAGDVLNMLPAEVPEGTKIEAFMGVEDQFTPEELEELNKHATHYMMVKYDPGSYAGTTWIDYSNILEMIKDYNSGKAREIAGSNAPEVIEALDRILASKRNVQLTVEGEHSKKETHVIPVPLVWPLFLLPLFIRRRRPEPTPEPLPPVDIVPEPLAFPNVPENVESGEFWLARFNALRDLMIAFDNPEAESRGINYRVICEQLDDNFERFRSQEDIITWIATEILEQWAICDASKINSEGEKVDVKELTHRYKNDPTQLMYALLHARELNDAVVEMITLPERTSDDDYTRTLYNRYFQAHNQIADAVMRP